MQYKVIGLMSGSSVDGLDIAYIHFEASAEKWVFDIRETACYAYDAAWTKALREAPRLSAKDYLILHTAYGKYIGERVNQFIAAHELAFQVQLIASHGHTAFHLPEQKMTAQLGDGSAIAATTGIHVISDFRSVDIALGGQGAPLVPMGEMLLLDQYDLFLNIGGIANISARWNGFTGFDVCPANSILNRLAGQEGRSFDEGGTFASEGVVNPDLLKQLNACAYYDLPFPKSLSNDFGTDIIYPLIVTSAISTKDALRTYVEHVCMQILYSLFAVFKGSGQGLAAKKLLVTGGGAHNDFLIRRLGQLIAGSGIELVIPDKTLIDFKEALIIGLLGTLRWREEVNVLSSVTGASRNSIGGMVCCG